MHIKSNELACHPLFLPLRILPLRIASMVFPASSINSVYFGLIHQNRVFCNRRTRASVQLVNLHIAYMYLAFSDPNI